MTSTSPRLEPFPATSAAHDSRLDLASRWVAEGVSWLFSPPLVATAMVILAVTQVAPSDGRRAAWLWGGGLVLGAVALPLAYLRWLVRTGRVSDMDVCRRHQRLRPMAFTLAAGITALCTLEWGGAPLFLCLVASLLWLLMAGLMGVSAWWKISVHGALAGAGLVLLWVCQEPLWAWALLPVLGWSRVRLGRHSVAQVIAGTAWGVALFGLGLALYGG